MTPRTSLGIVTLLLIVSHADTAERQFAGMVSSATPEATAAGVAILEAGGNAVDAAIAVSLMLGVTEPAGSGIGGSTVMLVRKNGENAVVVQGSTLSPLRIPQDAIADQLSSGYTSVAVPSNLRVLDVAHRNLGSGQVSWKQLVDPAAKVAEEGYIVGPFRHRSLRSYDAEIIQATAAGILKKPDGSTFQAGDRARQPLLAKTLHRIAAHGAEDFYSGKMAREIAADLEANGAWMTLEDLQQFPQPAIVPAVRGDYRGNTVESLPPPFAGWVVLQILNVLEQSDPGVLAHDDSARRLALLDALSIGHGSRRAAPILEYVDYDAEVASKTDKQEAQRLLAAYRQVVGGETTHFSVVDGDGTVVAVTQSIDSYFGAKVAHPTLGFLYNNYMQGFQVNDPEAPYFLTEHEAPLSSMSGTVVSRDGQNALVLGSPGSARIISAVAQATSHWIDVGTGIEAAVAAYRVHVVPPNLAYVEGPELPPELLRGMSDRGMTLKRPTYGVSDSQLDPYFGGIHALAFEDGEWTGAADPRRDGTVGTAWR